MSKDKGGKKVFPAKRFARGPLTCPSCREALNSATSRCPKCGFVAEKAVEKFPFPAPPLATVIDPSGLATAEEKKEVADAIEKARKKVPQVHFVNCIVSMGADINLGEFGYWMLNAAEMPEGNDKKHFTVLFLIDPKAKALSVTVGYGIEPFVTDSEWTSVLNEVKDHFSREKLGEGTVSYTHLTLPTICSV